MNYANYRVKFNSNCIEIENLDEQSMLLRNDIEKLTNQPFLKFILLTNHTFKLRTNGTFDYTLEIPTTNTIVNNLNNNNLI